MSCLILDVGCLWKKFETKYASWLTCKFTSSCQRLISICCKRNAIKNVEYKNCHNYNFGLMTPLWIWQCGFFRPQQQSWTKRKLLLISGRILLCQVCFWRKTLFPYNIPTFKISNPRWNRAKEKYKFNSNIDGLLLDFSSCCWKTCDNELYQICIRPWAVTQYL